MVQFIPAKNTWSEAFQNIGSGLAQGYMGRSDELAIQEAVGKLGPNASARDIVNAVTGAKVYNPQSKQNFFKNFLGERELEERIRASKEKESIEKSKLQEDETKKKTEREVADALIMNSKMPQKEKEALLGKADIATARAFATKPENITDYQIAENYAKRFEPEIKHYREKVIEDQSALPVLETAIVNNENYGKAEKWWDSTIDAINSPFLNPLKSKTGQQLETIVPISVASFGAKIPGVMTKARQELISKKAVGLGKDKDANRLMLYMDYYERKTNQLKSQFSNEILRESPYGLPPSDFDVRLKEKLKPYAKMIGRDLDRLAKGELPKEPISQLDLLRPGEVIVQDPQGNTYSIQEEALKLPKYKHLKRIEL